MTEMEQGMWGSHIPALMACVMSTTGPIVEFGVGHFSTPLLHVVATTMGRGVYSLEQDREWMEKFAPRFAKGSHIFCGGEYLDNIPWLPEVVGVAFIDHSPGGASRAKVFQGMIKCSTLVVVHDYHQDNEEHIAPLLGGMNTHVTRLYGPPTLVASYNCNLPKGIYAL